ncbi:MAG: hypothetical protein VX938_00935, partial [Myxococcota bacterium]|nr:hypothetical protein [Myxococcota bacterium]
MDQSLSYLTSADEGAHSWVPQELMTDGGVLPFGPASVDGAQGYVAAATIEVPRTRRLVLWLGGVGDVVIHLDGQEVGRTRGLAVAEPDQFSLPLDLTRGRHHLSVIMVAPAGAVPALHVRWSDRAGRPVRSVGQASAPSLQELRELGGAVDDGEGLMWTSGIDHGSDNPRDAILRASARRALGIPDAGAESAHTWPALETAVIRGGQSGVDSALLVLALAQMPRVEDRATALDQLIRIRPGDPVLTANRA